MDLFVYVFIGFVIIAIIAAYFSKKAADARRAALAQMAATEGYEFYPEGILTAAPTGGFFQTLLSGFGEQEEEKFFHRFAGFSPFGQGHSPGMCNLLVKSENGMDWYLFDYEYKTTQSNGKSTTTTTHPYGIVAVRLPLVLPALSLTPENVFHRIGSKLGVSELTFELEEFNKKYFIRCEEARLAHDLLHPQAIEHLMAHESRHWQMGGMFILLAHGGHYNPLEMRRIVEEIKGFVALIPEYFHQDRGFQPKWTSPLQ